ncbi:MAG: anthranilate phosphoribosyltransferase [Alphaproteobacteria bacterium]|nr:anthranilate phosphoribosyltransferase [Alphaproteobacteria bacterium]
MRDVLQLLVEGKDLSHEDASHAFSALLAGDVPEAVIAGFLAMLAQKGETVTEIAAGMQILHSKSHKLNAPTNAMDIVGTGGDGLNSYNISTSAALIVTACGVPVAKHGSASVSSKSGASDVLTALGVNIKADFATMQQSIDECGICFMFAPLYHPAVGNVMPARKALAIRTIFNFLGPICNPASVKRILLGTSEKRLLRPYAEILRDNGYQRFMVVHGENRMDELSLSCPTFTISYDGNQLIETTMNPADFGFEFCEQSELIGGTPEENAVMLKNIIAGKPSKCADLVLMNVAASLWVADKVSDIKQGVTMARDVIASGKPNHILQQFIAITNKA